MATLLDLAIRASVLLLLAWLATSVLRTRSASMRASIWTAAFTALLALPIVSVVVPAWQIPVLQQRVESAVTPVTPGAIDRDNEPAIPSTPGRTQLVSVEIPPAPLAPMTVSISWTVVTAAGLLLVASLLLSRTAFAYDRMRRIASTAVSADASWRGLVNNVGRELGVTGSVAVRITDATNVPAVAGVFTPILLIPSDNDAWPLDVRRAVVLHELAHIARRDALGQLASQVACALYWFIPLVWYGARRASAFRERASDDAVIRAGIRPSTYAGSLMALAQSSSRALESEAAMAMAESRIHERIAAILNPVARRNHLSARTILALATVTFAATVTLAAIEPVERPTDLARAPDSARAAAVPASAGQPDVPLTRAVPSRALRPPVQAPAAAASTRLCEGQGFDKSSNSVHENDRERRITIKVSGNACTVDVRAEGKFDFNAEFTDIARMDPNGSFRVDVTDKGVRRQLDIESKNGTLTRTWRIDGRERPYDDEARAWFASFLIELDRRTAMGIDVRLPLLLKQGGVSAVLSETGLMSSDYARSQYYLKLPTVTKVSSAETTRILQQAVTRPLSDYYKAELVGAYVSNVQDPAVKAALMGLVEPMQSDYYQASSIETILGNGTPGPTEMDVMLRLVPRMKSDHYKAQVLLKALKATSISAGHRVAIATAAESIASDYNAADVLKALAKGGLDDDAVRKSFFAAAARLKSPVYGGEVLKAVLASSSATERDLLDVLSIVKAMSGDYYKADLLEEIARHRGATERVKAGVIDAAAALSSHYAEQVKRAAGR